jgi:hypothetical protein
MVDVESHEMTSIREIWHNEHCIRRTNKGVEHKEIVSSTNKPTKVDCGEDAPSLANSSILIDLLLTVSLLDDSIPFYLVGTNLTGFSIGTMARIPSSYREAVQVPSCPRHHQG